MRGLANVREIFFEGTVSRMDASGTPYVAFRVEVTTNPIEESYALTHLRFSALFALHEGLSKRHEQAVAALPPFPAKTWTSPSDEEWLRRCSMLTGYCSAVLRVPELVSDEQFAEAFSRTASAEEFRLPVDLKTPQEDDEEQRFRFVDVDGGLRVGYIDRGQPEAPLILFVHGFPDTLWTWDRAMTRIAEKGYYCVSMAMRGYYPTTAPTDNDVETPDWKKYGKQVLGRDILNVIKALNKSAEGAVVIGHDFGAVAMWSAAVLDQLEGTRLISKVVGEALPPPKALALNASMLLAARHIVYYNTPLVDTVKGTKARRAALAVKRHFSKPGRTEAAVAFYRAVRPPKEARPIFEPLNTTDIKVPVLFICGENDNGGGLIESFKQTGLQCAGFCEIVVVREAGHFVHSERPSGFLHKLLPFLDQKEWPDNGKQVKVKYVQETTAPVQEPKKIT